MTWALLQMNGQEFQRFLSSVSSFLDNWLLNRLVLLLHHCAWIISCITNSYIQFTNALANLYIPTQIIVELNCDYALDSRAPKTNSAEFLLAKIGGKTGEQIIQRLERSATRARKNRCLLPLWGSGQRKVLERMSRIQDSAYLTTWTAPAEGAGQLQVDNHPVQPAQTHHIFSPWHTPDMMWSQQSRIIRIILYIVYWASTV